MTEGEKALLKKHTKRFFFPAALLLLLLAAAGADVLLCESGGALREWEVRAVQPVSAFFLRLRQEGERVEDYFRGIDALRQENTALRESLTEAKRKAAGKTLAEQENARLRKLLSLEQRRQSFETETAWVIARSSEPWRKTVRLDKGSRQGIKKGQCVITAEGSAAGQVIEIGDTWCTVALPGDTECRLAGQGGSSGILGNLQEGKLSGLPAGLRMQKGETVVTFGTQGLYPSGLVLGTVKEDRLDPGGLTRSAVLEFSVEPDTLSEVFIITSFQETR